LAQELQHGGFEQSALPPDWLTLVLASSSEEEVASIANDYLRTCTPEDIFRLPEDCRPGRIRDGEDINNYAFQLAHAHCFDRVGPDGVQVLEKLMVFFTHASTHVAHLQAQNAWSAEE
jgi:hypothetical protein